MLGSSTGLRPIVILAAAMAVEIIPELVVSGASFFLCRHRCNRARSWGLAVMLFYLSFFFFFLGLFFAFNLCVVVGMKDLSCFLALFL